MQAAHEKFGGTTTGMCGKNGGCRLPAGREEELLEEMKKYRLEVLGESKIKMKGNGSKAVGEGRCIFAGVEEGRAKAGVATFLSKRMSESLKEWKCIN